MENKLIKNTKAVKYSERFRYFELVDGKYIIQQWCKNINLHPFLFPDKFYNHLETEKRYSLWVGGNGSAKSTSKARYFIMRLLKQDFCRVLALRHNQTDLRNSVFLMLKGIITKDGLDDDFTVLENMTIICNSTKNMILFAGLDNVGKLSGIDDVTDIWFEEPITRSKSKINMITHDEFVDLDSRLRMPNAKLTMHLTLNPITKNFFIYKNLINPKPEEEVKLNIEDWDICNSNYLDNPFLPDDYIKVVQGFTGIRAEYGRDGTWAEERTGNEWLSNFIKSKHVKNVPYVVGLEVHKGFDFNMLPYQTCIDLQLIRLKNGKFQVRVFKEYCLKPPLNSPENACKFFIEDYIQPYGYNSVNIYGDASGRYGYDNYYGIFKELERYTNHQDSDQVLKKNPPLRMARDLINEILSGIHNIEMLIDEECVNLINDLETLQTAPDGFDPERDKQGVETKGHCYSALVYILAVIFDYLMKHNQR